MKKILRELLFISIALIPVLSSCKKDEETTYLAFSGTVELSGTLPAFVKAGEQFSFSVSGAKRSSEDSSTKSIGYYIYSNMDAAKDTLRFEGGDWISKSHSCTIPADTLDTYTVTGAAYGSGYYITSASTSATIVNDNLDGTGSITGFTFDTSDEHITDSRDGRIYYTTEAGGLSWLRQNMAYGDGGVLGKAYQNCDVTSYIFGRYYSYEQAKSACPAGWRLPTKTEWDSIYSDGGNKVGNLMEDIYFNGTQMWEYWPQTDPTNSTRLSLMPCGYAEIEGNGFRFKGICEYASFWTSDENGDKATVVYLYDDTNSLFSKEFGKNDFAASVRCVK